LRVTNSLNNNNSSILLHKKYFATLNCLGIPVDHECDHQTDRHHMVGC